MTRSFVSLTTGLIVFLALTAIGQQPSYYYDSGQYAQSSGGYYRQETPPPPPPSSPPPAAYGQTYQTAPGEPLPTEPPPDYSPDRGPYFRAEVGPSFFGNTHLTHFGVPANDPVHFKTGFALNAAGGYAFNQNISGDLEVGFIGAEVDHIKFFTFDEARYYNLPFLANLTVSFPIDDARIVPYFGAGAGGSVAVFDTKNLTTPANPTINGREATAVFAGQVFAGVRVRLNSRMWLGAGYKYFTTEDPTWTYPNDFKFGFKRVDTHSVQFTFLWKF